MKEAILNFPQQFEVGLQAARGIEVNKEINKIVIGGMGGSALPASLLITYKPDLKTPIYVPRTYGLPPQTDQNTLVIAISYSGNTEETVSGFEEAIERKLKPIAVTSGGKLKKLAQENNLPVAEIPTGIQPRQAIGYQFSALLKILNNCEIIPDVEKPLLQAAQNLKPEQLEERGKELSQTLVNKLPIIYASKRFKSLARIWKIKFNENDKVMAFWNYFPELNHNEMTGFDQIEKQISPERIQVLMLKEEKSKRMKLTEQLLREKGISVEEIEIEGNSILEKIFNNLLLSDWTTYHLAQKYGVEPEPVPIIEDFKKQL